MERRPRLQELLAENTPCASSAGIVVLSHTASMKSLKQFRRARIAGNRSTPPPRRRDSPLRPPNGGPRSRPQRRWDLSRQRQLPGLSLNCSKECNQLSDKPSRQTHYLCL